MKILKHADDLALAGVTAIEAQTMAAFPASLKAQGQLGRWRRSSILHHWNYLPMSIAERAKEIPNWLKLSMHQEKQKGRTSSWFIPMPLQIQYDKVLNSRVNHCSSQQQIKEVLLTRHVMRGMQDVLDEYNQSQKVSNSKIDRKNTATYQAWEEGKITDDQAKDHCK